MNAVSTGSGQPLSRVLVVAALVTGSLFVGIRPTEATVVCPSSSGFPLLATVVVLTAPDTSTSCGFSVLRSAPIVVTLTMTSINTASATLKIDGVVCASVTGISGASTNLCNAFTGFHTVSLTMTASAVSAHATITPTVIP